jgi:hypothetical protein
VRDGEAGTISMGKRSGSSSEFDTFPYFTGAFDDVRIFNRSLSQAEISTFGSPENQQSLGCGDGFCSYGLER